MTTIAWDGTYLAADKQASGRYTVGKVFPMADGSFLAGAGNYSQIIEIATWIATGGAEAAKPNLCEEQTSEVLWVFPDGSAYWLTWPYLRRVKLNEKFATLGSGGDYALGALAMGATAKQAVQIASRFDADTGKGITTVRVRK